MKSIRALSVAAIAAAALFVVPSIASAGQFTADGYPATIEGAQASTWVVKVGETEFACGSGANFGASLSGAYHTLPATSWAGGCANMGTCRFEFKANTDSVDIGPAGCGPAKFFANFGACTWEVGAQTGIPATYTNTGTGTGAGVTVSVATSKLKYTNPTFSVVCGKAGTYENMQFNVSWKLTAKNFGAPVGMHAYTPKTPVGIFMNGTTPAWLDAEMFPVKTTVERGETPSELTLFKFGEATATCKSIAGTQAGTTSQVALNEFSGCILFGAATTVNANSCSYRLNVTKRFIPESGLFLGTTAISCSKEGDALEFVTPSCTLSVPAQNPAGTVNYENKYSGSAAKVQVNVSASGIKYTKKGLCPGAPGGENATSKWYLPMRGNYAS